MFTDRKITSERELEDLLAEPSQKLVDMMKRIDGDIIILGIAGKVGISMGIQAVEAIRRAGVSKKVYGVARFSNAAEREKLDAAGIVTVACDLMDREQVEKLPKCENVIFMAGRKFGTQGSEAATWAVNTIAPAITAEYFRDSRIVAFSTGCVYPLRTIGQGGCTEETAPAPVGEYAQSCLGRERIFQYYAKKYNTRLLLFRLNYSVDLRYGVLDDIGRAIWEGRPVSNTVGYYNVIWQGDVTEAALLSLELAAAPCEILNVTGPENGSVKETALMMGRIMEKDVHFQVDTPGELNYLNDAGKMFSLFGYPRVSLNELIRMQAEWIKNGGISIGKPTHFEVNDGKF